MEPNFRTFIQKNFCLKIKHKIMSIHKVHHFVADLAQVWSVQLCAIGISFTDVAETIKLGGYLVAAGYTAWKWLTDYRDRKDKKENP